MSNQPDSTSTGTIVSLDAGGMEIPVTIAQKATGVTVDVKRVNGSFVGTLNADGTQLVGTWTQGPLVLPLTFTHAQRNRHYPEALTNEATAGGPDPIPSSCLKIT